MFLVSAGKLKIAFRRISSRSKKKTILNFTIQQTTPSADHVIGNRFDTQWPAYDREGRAQSNSVVGKRKFIFNFAASLFTLSIDRF